MLMLNISYLITVCGQPTLNPSKIVGGVNASEVSLHGPIYGASLIDREWVLLAAQCFSE